MCEPHSVATDLTYLGFALSLMSKIRMPSQPSGRRRAGSRRPSSERGSSTDRNSRFPATETSFCPPGQSTRLTTFGLVGSLMSWMVKPSKLPMNA